MLQEKPGKVAFKHWVTLQRCLKYEKLRVSHGASHLDESETTELLSRLKGLHLDYYEKQLQTRCLLSKVKSTRNPSRRSGTEIAGNSWATTSCTLTNSSN